MTSQQPLLDSLRLSQIHSSGPGGSSRQPQAPVSRTSLMNLDLWGRFTYHTYCTGAEQRLCHTGPHNLYLVWIWTHSSCVYLVYRK